ncbi:MAG: hypothetical protein ACP5K1_04290 [Candidatus Bathyarchaeia archaeon]
MRERGVPEYVAEMASSYGNLDSNKEKLGDYLIRINEIEPDFRAVERYQTNLLKVLKEEDPQDISSERLETLDYIFKSKELAINMLELCMYDKVFEYIDMVKSKYENADPKFRDLDGENSG